MRLWSLKFLLFGAALWLIVLVAGLVNGNDRQIAVGAVVAGLFLVLAALRARDRRPERRLDDR
jgi:hypothetical protein